MPGPRVLLQAGHAALNGYPVGGGAPGEAAWTPRLTTSVAALLTDRDVEAVVVGNWYGLQPPPETASDYALARFYHSDASVYGESRNTGRFSDRWRPEALRAAARTERLAIRSPFGRQDLRSHEAALGARAARGVTAAGRRVRASAPAALSNPNAAAEERFIAIHNRVYAASGIALHEERRNANTSDYYGYRATTARTPGVLTEFGCGATTGVWNAERTRYYPPGQDREYLHGRLDEVARLEAAAIVAFLGVPPPSPPGPPGGDRVPILTEAERREIAAAVWNDAAVPFNPEAAAAKAWLGEWTAGRDRGQPRTGEVPFSGGVWQQFDGGRFVWTPDRGGSWEG